MLGCDEDGFVIGVDYETCFALIRLLYKLPLAIVHGDFIPISPVGIVSAYFRGAQNNFIAYLPPTYSNNYVRRMVFLGMQPNIVGGRVTQQSVVLDIVSPRVNGNTLILEFTVG